MHCIFQKFSYRMGSTFYTHIIVYGWAPSPESVLSCWENYGHENLLYLYLLLFKQYLVLGFQNWFFFQYLDLLSGYWTGRGGSLSGHRDGDCFSSGYVESLVISCFSFVTHLFSSIYPYIGICISAPSLLCSSECARAHFAAACARISQEDT